MAEVALSIQFAERLTDDARTLGDFWPSVRGDFPRLEQHPALPRMQEDFGPPQPPRIEFMAEAPPVRFWFLTDDTSCLVQVQPDRFTANWRKVQADTPYPRYRRLREQFEELLRTFVEAVNPPVDVIPDWCEVTYVNHVLAPERGAAPPRLSEIVTLVSDPPAGVLPEPEDVQLLERFLLREGEEHGAPIGRLHITAAPAIRTTDQVPLQQITLTARGRPSQPDIEGGLTFLDYGRDLVVRGFREITTPEMHSRWRLEV